jgi:N-acetylmuramoyl-L-alanine amidase
VNSASIGIELVNPGHEHGYRDFAEPQLDSLIGLVGDIKERYAITRGNVVGHSDVAPMRKQDPGELFPWSRLARLRLALPRPTKNLMDPMWTDAGFLIALERFGYDVKDKLAAVVAFQRRYRPELIDGEIDGECRSILLALLLPKPQGDD